MEHIKNFRVFENKEQLPQNILDNLTDMFSDLTDEGYDVSYWNAVPEINVHYPNIQIKKILGGIHRVIPYSEIKDFIIRIKQYLLPEGYGIRLYYITRGYSTRDVESKNESSKCFIIGIIENKEL